MLSLLISSRTLVLSLFTIIVGLLPYNFFSLNGVVSDKPTTNANCEVQVSFSRRSAPMFMHELALATSDVRIKIS